MSGLLEQINSSNTGYNGMFTEADLTRFLTESSNRSLNQNRNWTIPTTQETMEAFHRQMQEMILYDESSWKINEHWGNENIKIEMITVERNERGEPVIRISDVKKLMDNGYVPKRRNKGYDKERKNSIIDVYNITEEAIDSLFKHRALAGVKTTFPNGTKTAFIVQDDVMQETSTSEGESEVTINISGNDIPSAEIREVPSSIRISVDGPQVVENSSNDIPATDNNLPF